MTIHNYIEENLFAPARKWPEHEFRKRSYGRWAAYEILKRIQNAPEAVPFLVILYFRYEMDYLSGIREDSDAEFMFITARDIADEIITLF